MCAPGGSLTTLAKRKAVQEARDGVRASGRGQSDEDERVEEENRNNGTA